MGEWENEGVKKKRQRESVGEINRERDGGMERKRGR
jgi:hypothetical protein